MKVSVCMAATVQAYATFDYELSEGETVEQLADRLKDHNGPWEVKPDVFFDPDLETLYDYRIIDITTEDGDVYYGENL